MTNLNLTVLDEWLSYQSAVLPQNCPAIQRVETRRAFYAGAQAMLALIARIDEDVPDEQGVEYLERFRRELQGFAELVAQGAA